MNFENGITPAKKLKQLNDWEIPLTLTMTVITIALIYLLNLSQRMMTNVTEKTRPITDTTILSLSLFIIEFSSLVFKFALLGAVHAMDKKGSNENIYELICETNRMRYVIMSVEMLFICIPIKHNFQPHQLEL